MGLSIQSNTTIIYSCDTLAICIHIHPTTGTKYHPPYHQQQLFEHQREFHGGTITIDFINLEHPSPYEIGLEPKLVNAGGRQQRTCAAECHSTVSLLIIYMFRPCTWM